MDRQLLRVVAVVVLVALSGCAGGTSSSPTASTPSTDQRVDPETKTATVLDIVDGDTIDVRFSDGSTDRVRLLGVDTPEVHVEVDPEEYEGVPDSESGRQCLRDWGTRASKFATEHLANATVTVKLDPVADRRGGFDRLLAYVIIDGENFNQKLLEEGYARVYDSRFTMSAQFYTIERNTQDAGIGLWSCRSGN